MNPINSSLNWCCKKTGLSTRAVIWSMLSLFFMVIFTVLFTLPQMQRIKTLSTENAQVEAQLEGLNLLKDLERQLNRIMEETYPDIERINAEAFDENQLLELPAQFEELAAGLGVTLISIDSSSVDDGAHVSINAVFQGDLIPLSKLLIKLGRVEYVKRLESISMLALADAEQMNLKFTVPIK